MLYMYQVFFWQPKSVIILKPTNAALFPWQECFLTFDNFLLRQKREGYGDMSSLLKKSSQNFVEWINWKKVVLESKSRRGLVWIIFCNLYKNFLKYFQQLFQWMLKVLFTLKQVPWYHSNTKFAKITKNMISSVFVSADVCQLFQAPYKVLCLCNRALRSKNSHKFHIIIPRRV